MVGHTPLVGKKRSETMNSTTGRLDRSQLQKDKVISPMIRRTRNSTINVPLSAKTSVKVKTRRLKLQTKLVSVGSPSKKTMSNISEASNGSETVEGNESFLTEKISNVQTLKISEASFQQPMDLDSEDTQFDELQLLDASQTTEKPINKNGLTSAVVFSDTAQATGSTDTDANNSQEPESTSVLQNERKRKMVGADNEKEESDDNDSDDDTFTWEYSTPPPYCSSNGRSILRKKSTTEKPNDGSSIAQPNLTSQTTSSKVDFAGVNHERFFDSSKSKNNNKKAIPKPKKRKTGSNPTLKTRAAYANAQLFSAESQSASSASALNPSTNKTAGFKPAVPVPNWTGAELNNEVLALNRDSSGFDTTKLSSLEKNVLSSNLDSPLLFSQLNDPSDTFVESQIGIGTDCNKAIFPALQTCQDSISGILKELTSTPEHLGSVFSKFNIKTVGDLCGRTKAEISQFPIRSPRKYTLNLVLENYLKKTEANMIKLITAPIKLQSDSQNSQQSQLLPKRSKIDEIKELYPQSRILQTIDDVVNLHTSQIHRSSQGDTTMIDSQALMNSCNTSPIVDFGTDPSLNRSSLTQSKNDTDVKFVKPKVFGTKLPTTSPTLDFGNLEVIEQLQKFIKGKHGDALLNQLLSDVTVADKVQSGMINRWHDADEKFLKAKEKQNSPLTNLTEKSIESLYQDFAKGNDASSLSSEFWNRQLFLLFSGYKSWMSENDANDKPDAQLWMKIVDILKKQHPSYFLECPSDDSSLANCVKYMIKSFAKFPDAALIPEQDILTLLPDLLKRMSPETQSKFFISRMKFF